MIRGEEKKCFLEMETTPGDGVVKTTEITSEFRILMGLVDKSGKVRDDWLQFCKNVCCG